MTHYFFEFEIYDKRQDVFLDLESRLSLLEGTGIQTVPVVHTGTLSRDDLGDLIGPSQFDSHFENPITRRPDNLMEGLFLRTEAKGAVTAREVRAPGVCGEDQAQHALAAPADGGQSVGE